MKPFILIIWQMTVAGFGGDPPPVVVTTYPNFDLCQAAGQEFVGKGSSRKFWCLPAPPPTGKE